jgi:hypothetical protein
MCHSIASFARPLGLCGDLENLKKQKLKTLAKKRFKSEKLETFC